MRIISCGLDLAHDGVDQPGGGNFLCLFDQFDGFIHGGMGGNFCEERLLVYAHTQGGKDLKVEFAKRSETQQGDGLVEHGAPAQDAHDDLGDKVAVDGGEFVEQSGMQKLHGVGRLAIHPQKDVECGESRWRDGLDGLASHQQLYCSAFYGTTFIQGLKPIVFCVFTARLKSCPDTCVYQSQL